MKPIESLSLDELWQLFPIILTEPNPLWPTWAEEEMQLLRTLLSPSDVATHHIGSTAINGIWAKPIIDILLTVDAPSTFPRIKRKMQQAEYICMSESPDRISFNKGYTSRGYAEKVFHIHLRTKADTDEIYFRDYLNLHPDIARQYERLKLSLSKLYAHNRDAYTEAKTDFVTRYTTLARRNLLQP